MLSALLLQITLLSVGQPARADPEGFGDRQWGTRWTVEAIASLPGCTGQGETVADVEGLIARVAQPECLGYRLSDQLTVDLILLYPEIKWHPLDGTRRILSTLVESGRLWGLTPETIAELRGWSEHLERVSYLRAVHGAAEPVFRDMAQVFDLPDSMRGLQGYQLNFRQEQYHAVRSLMIRSLGPPTRERLESKAGPISGPVVEVLEWHGAETMAVMRESGGCGRSGHFALVTRAYLALLAEHSQKAANHRSRETLERAELWWYPWVLDVLEDFRWLWGVK